jgi:co-chaperonin GroES (HSP10)
MVTDEETHEGTSIIVSRMETDEETHEGTSIIVPSMETDEETHEGTLIIVPSMETNRNHRQQFFPQFTMDRMLTRAWRLVSFPAVKCLPTFIP